MYASHHGFENAFPITNARALKSDTPLLELKTQLRPQQKHLTFSILNG